MTKNSAERGPRPVEIAGASGGGVVEGGSTEQAAAALNKEAARPSSGVGGTSSYHRRVGKSASGGTRARKRAGSTTGQSVGAGSKKAKPSGRSGTRKGSRKTSQPSGATRVPPSEQETPERGTKRPGPSTGAEQVAEEEAQQPAKTKRQTKRKKNAFDVAFEAWRSARGITMKQRRRSCCPSPSTLATNSTAKISASTIPMVRAHGRTAWLCRSSQSWARTRTTSEGSTGRLCERFSSPSSAWLRWKDGSEAPSPRPRLISTTILMRVRAPVVENS